MFTSWSRRYGRSPGLTSRLRRAQGIRNRILLGVELLEDRTVPAPLTNGAFTQAVDFTQPPNGQNWQASDANFVSISASPSGGQAYIQDNGQFAVTTSLYQNFQLPANLPANASLSFVLNIVSTDDSSIQPPGFGAALLDPVTGLSLVPTVSASDSFYTRDLLDGNTGLIPSGVTETWVNPAQAPAVLTTGVPGKDTPTPATAQGQQFIVTLAIPSALAGQNAEILFQVVSNGDGLAKASIAAVAVNTSATPVITSLSLTSATEGSSPFTLTVNGSNFDQSSIVNWNGTGLTTTLLSGVQLQAVVPAADIAEEGSANVTVVSAGGQSSALPFAIGDAALTGTSTATAGGTEAASNSSVLSTATFSDANTGAPASDFTATITWGDGGPTSTGTVSGSGGSYSVAGAHTYAEEGSYSISISVVDDGGKTATLTGTATIADPAVSATGINLNPGEAQFSTNDVATFTDPGGAETNDGTHYSSTIDWGDNSTSSGFISFSGSLGSKTDAFTVTGSHNYSEEGSYQVTTTVNHEGVITTTTSTATVVDANLAGSSAATAGGTEGASNSSVLSAANFTDANSGAPATDFTATITWGDGGATSTGTVMGSGGSYSVAGAHTYAEEGSYTISISVADVGGKTATITGTATVADPAVSATGVNLNPGEAQFSTNDVATFTDPGGAEANDGTHYSATIDWGDNSTSPGIINFSGSSGSKTDAFTVLASHNYSEEGNYQVTTTINHEGIITTTTSTATVADANLAGSSAATAGGTEGAANSSVLSGATFRDANSGAPAIDFTAVITWGDGKISNGIVTGSGGSYSVAGWHTYAEQGSYNISISVADDGGQTATITGTATVGDAALTGSGTATAGGTEAAVNSSVLSAATFSDANSGAPASDFTATITWGDGGATSTGTVSGSGGSYSVAGSHTYTEEGSYAISIAVVDDGGQTATITGTATVGDAALTGSSTATAAGTEGASNSSVLAAATFSDANSAAPAGDFTATITWGDGGPTSTGTVTGSGGSYSVAGWHTYAEQGSYAISIAVVDGGGQTATITGTATVGDAALTGSSTATAGGTEAAANSSVLSAATFTDGNSAAPASDFTAAITWGDGGDTSTGTVMGSGGSYSVAGSHTYAEEGSYAISIKLADDGGQTATITGTATVSDAALTGSSTATAGGTEGASNSGMLFAATFTDGNSAAPASDFTATITWGDGGDTSTGMVMGSGGSYSVAGSHTYAEEGSYAISISVVDDGGQTATITGTATVADPAVSATGINFNPGEAQFGTNDVATFTDPGGAEANDGTHYSATIDWGDNSTSPGIISFSGSLGSKTDAFAVLGSHNYSEEGSYQVTTTINHEGIITTTSTATVADANLAGSSAATADGTEGAANSSVLSGATFSDANSGAPASDFTAVITWGDGGPTSTGTVTGSNGSYSVAGAHTYAEEGSYNVSISVVDDGGKTATITGTATVGDAALTAGTVSASGGVEGGSATTLSATFADSNSAAPASDFTATITWGDGGPTSTGTVTGSGGSYSVAGLHTYAEEGSYAISIAVADDGGQTATITGTATVGDAALTGSSTATAGGTEAASNSSALSAATFSDANSRAPAGDFTATITWGDGGPTSTGTVTGSGGSYSVAGSHTYAEEGSYAISIAVADVGGQTATITGTATVGDAALTGSSTATAGGSEGASNSSVLAAATFTDANTAAPATDFTATITWGDGGPTSTGTVTGSGGSYSVAGSHTYAEEGSYAISIAVADDGGQTATITGTATVGDAALTGSSTATAGGSEGASNSSVLAAATFTDANTAAPAGHFTATITWGDGGPTSTGTVTGSGGSYSVAGSHTYAEEGSYSISIAVADDGGQMATITGTATVGDAALTDSSTATAGGIEGASNSSVLSAATFSDANSGAPAGDFTATITWGDGGPTSTGTVAGSGGTYSVAGSHTYAEEGSYAISISVVDDGGNTATITGTATVGDAALTGSGTTTAAGAEGASNSSVLAAATFTDANTAAPASDFTATITWGDGGATSTGTVSGSGGSYSVVGTHTYAEEGSYTISIGVVDDGGKTATITGTATVNLVPPTAAIAGPSTAIPGQPITFTLSATSPSPSDQAAGFTFTINWGDGSALQTIAATPGNGAGTAVSHVFSTAGTFTPQVQATDDGGASSSLASGPSVTAAAYIYALDPSASGAITLTGNASISTAGQVIDDSSSATALTAGGNASLTASSIQVVGGAIAAGNAKFSPAPVTGISPVPDPLAALSAPTGGAVQGSVNLSGNSTLTINPGIYTSITASGNASLTLNPGIYVLAGDGLSVSGNGSLSGTGVMLYNAGSNYPNAGGSFDGISLSGNGTVHLVAPTSGSYAGILIFQSRDNKSPLTISGNAALVLGGTVYAPAATLTLSGNGDLQEALVVDKLLVSGNGGAQLSAGSSAAVAYTPDQIRTAYGINDLSLDGTGQTIAIVTAYDDPGIYQALDQFDTQFGSTAAGLSLFQQYGPAWSFLTVINQNGQSTGLPQTDPAGPGTANWETEAALDVEWAHAVAPGAQIVLVEANSQSLGDLMAGVSTAAGLPGVSVVSMSWGYAEGQSVFAGDEALYDSVFTTPGVTFVASSGDYAAAALEYPALSPNVLAVGGTTLTLNADSSYKSEAGWGYYSNALGEEVGSGGGISLYEPEPAYQQHVQATGNRTTPDVSFVGDPATGAWIADPYNLPSSNSFAVVGGTSLSAPNWAGLIALINQGRQAAGKTSLGSSGPGATQQALYGLSQTDYHAIASGNNGYAAGPGYNLVTGLGTPVANLLVPDLIAGSSSGPAVAAIQSSGLVYSGGSAVGGTSVISVFTAIKASQGPDLAGSQSRISASAAHSDSLLFPGSEALVLAAARNAVQGLVSFQTAFPQTTAHALLAASDPTVVQSFASTTPARANDKLPDAADDGGPWLKAFDLDWIADTPNGASPGDGADSRVEAVAAAVLEWVGANTTASN